MDNRPLPRGEQMASSQTPSSTDEDDLRPPDLSLPNNRTERRVTDSTRGASSGDARTEQRPRRDSTKSKRFRLHRSTPKKAQSKKRVARENRNQASTSGSKQGAFQMIVCLSEHNRDRGDISPQEKNHDDDTLQSKLNVVKSGTGKCLSNVEQERRNSRTPNKTSIEKMTSKSTIQMNYNRESDDEEKAKGGLKKSGEIGKNSKIFNSIINQPFINNTEWTVYPLRGEGDGNQSPQNNADDTVGGVPLEGHGAVGGHPDTPDLVSDDAGSGVSSELPLQDILHEDSRIHREQEVGQTVSRRADRGEARRRQRQYAPTDRNLHSATQPIPQDPAAHSARARPTSCRRERNAGQDLGRPCPASRGAPTRPASVQATVALFQSASVANAGIHIRGRNTSVEETPDSLNCETPVPCQGEDPPQDAHGHHVQLQNEGAINGHDPGAGTGNRWVCRICREQLFRDQSQAALLFDCQHLVLCENCAVRVQVCPVCEAVVRYFIPVRH